MVHILLEICRFGSDKHCRSQFVSLCLLPVTAVGAPIVLTFLVYTLNVHGDMASVHFVAQFKVELFFLLKQKKNPSECLTSYTFLLLSVYWHFFLLSRLVCMLVIPFI